MTDIILLSMVPFRSHKIHIKMHVRRFQHQRWVCRGCNPLDRLVFGTPKFRASVAGFVNFYLRHRFWWHVVWFGSATEWNVEVGSYSAGSTFPKQDRQYKFNVDESVRQKRLSVAQPFISLHYRSNFMAFVEFRILVVVTKPGFPPELVYWEFFDHISFLETALIVWAASVFTFTDGSRFLYDDVASDDGMEPESF